MRIWAPIAVVLSLLLSGCASQQRVGADQAPAIQAVAEIPEAELLDVGIEIFDFGPAPDPETQTVDAFLEDRDQGSAVTLPWGEAEADEGLEELRKAESHFIPYHLRLTLQATGHWGAVRVLPMPLDGVDVLVSGRILASDGERLVLQIRARDSAGRRWLEQTYAIEAHRDTYKFNHRGEKDPYQGVYDRIANDLLAFKQGLDSRQRRELGTISELRFAAAVSPQAFGSYLRPDGAGELGVDRLPALDDPTIARLRRIREREHLFVDTVNEHYAYFYDEMWEPYESWRRYHYAEAVQLKEMERKALLTKVLGAAAVVGAVAYEMTSDGRGSAGLRNLMIIGGAAAFQRGLEISREAEIHADAIRELGASFDADIAPQVLEVEGRTVELKGTAQVQFAEWRRLVREIYLAETGLAPAAAAGGPVSGPVVAPD